MSVAVNGDGGRSAFEGPYPEPLRGVVNHAERFSVALSLAEMDESRNLATGPRELSLLETWVVGRPGEIEAFVGDVVREWRAGGLSARSASIVIESYLVALHRDMVSETMLGEPTCCSTPQDAVTLDFRELRGINREAPPHHRRGRVITMPWNR